MQLNRKTVARNLKRIFFIREKIIIRWTVPQCWDPPENTITDNGQPDLLVANRTTVLNIILVFKKHSNFKFGQVLFNTRTFVLAPLASEWKCVRYLSLDNYFHKFFGLINGRSSLWYLFKFNKCVQ